MPAGITNPALGYVTFCAVKFVGYSLAGAYLARSYGRPDIGAVRVGAARTLIGMVAGALYAASWHAAGGLTAAPGSAASQSIPFWYLAGLLPIRMAEWWLLIWIFYDRKLAQAGKDCRIVMLGTVWSYILDAPAIAGFIVTAGFWVC
jgi:hypothetical protein